MKKFLITILEVVLIALAIFGIVTVLNSVAFSEDLYEMYVICQPDDYVNVRMNPSRKSSVVGYVEAGDRFLTDGRKKNGYIRCYGIGETGEGWIHCGYVVDDRPERVSGTAVVVSNGRLAARKCIGGKTRKWLKNMDIVKIYWISDEWAITDKGFVKNNYLEMEGA